jgi:hypothetical protein
VINKKSVKNIDENFLYSSVLSRELCLQLLVLIVRHDKMQLRNSVPLWFRFGSMIFLRLSGFPKKQATNIYSVFPKIPTMLYSMSSWCPIWIICRVEFGWIWYMLQKVWLFWFLPDKYISQGFFSPSMFALLSFYMIQETKIIVREKKR